MQHELLTLFVESARRGSISAGGRALGLSPAAASAAIKRLEKKLGVRLLERSTRSLSLTSAGEEYLSMIAPALEQLDEARLYIQEQQNTPKGDIRLSIPSDLGRSLIALWIMEFHQQYPDIRLHLSVSDRPVDLIDDSIDLAIRYGQLSDSSLISRLLLHNQRVLCASSNYLQRHGIPTTPDELINHQCLTISAKSSFNQHWQLQYPEHGKRKVAIRNALQSDDGNLIRLWALQGAGIALKSWTDVCQDIQTKKLIRVLPEWSSLNAPLQLIYVQKQLQPGRIRLLVDFLVKKFQRFEQSQEMNHSE